MNITLQQNHSSPKMQNNMKDRQRSRQKKNSNFGYQQAKEKKKKEQSQHQQQDQDFDMFADDDLIPDHNLKGKGLDQDQKNTIVTDQSGYYMPVIGSTIGSNTKYKIVDKLGKGVFGIVLKGIRQSDDQQFAIKVLRKNDMTEKSGIKEFKILSEMHSKNKLKRILKVYDHFYEKGHFCFVCQILGSDLRSFTHKKQPTLDDIRLYAISMLMISHELRTAKIVHADIKPDNFMFKDLNLLQKFEQSLKDRKQTDKEEQNIEKMRFQEKAIIDNLRLVDFGTSYSVQQYSNSIEYQVARYYRSPEIILGTQIKKSEAYAIDVWAIGCSLFELFTNKFLFNGNSNNDMLKIIMQTRGRFSIKMLNKSIFKSKHFDDDYNFTYYYVDSSTKNMTAKKMQVNITPERQLMGMIKKSINCEQQDMKKLQNFRDFLQRCLALNPKDRLTPQQAMQHPFIHYQVKLNS